MKLIFKTLFSSLVVLSLANAQAGTIQQTIQFNGVSAARVFHAFTDKDEHERALGEIAAPVSIAPVVGAKYAVYTKLGGGLTGETLAVTPNKQLVLSLRGAHFPPNTTDATVVFIFTDNEKGAQIEMVDVNVPDAIRAEVNTHWNTYYWDLFRTYLAVNKQ
jgi:uncharacterized protein YndB with AHSA1/START domain